MVHVEFVPETAFDDLSIFQCQHRISILGDRQAMHDDKISQISETLARNLGDLFRYAGTASNTSPCCAN